MVIIQGRYVELKYLDTLIRGECVARRERKCSGTRKGQQREVLPDQQPISPAAARSKMLTLIIDETLFETSCFI